MPTNILVVGGAGYIGSHMVLHLQREGFNPIVVDDLSTGHKDVVQDADFVVGHIADHHMLDEVFKRYSIAAVMHFASFIQVGESVIDPAKYYLNNVGATLTLLESMRKHGIKHFIFSSTAAVYGEPLYTPIDEKHTLAPINPYGQSKRMIEQVLEDFTKAYDFNFAALRYFNAAGADPSGCLCERHDPETHLIPLILQVAEGKRKAITVFGRDYATVDGTCVRDYIHVNDLCAAHLLALKALFAGKKKAIYNLGTGQGYTVQQVIDAASEVTGKKIPVIEGERRAGDPAVLVANPNLAMQEMQWEPRYSDLKTIIQDAWKSFGH
jgi:UDP-glucose 4-epimerase